MAQSIVSMERDEIFASVLQFFVEINQKLHPKFTIQNLSSIS